MNSLLESYIVEAREMLESASETILALEKTPDAGDRLDELFRSIHTLKGTSGMFDNLNALYRLVHVAEDGLDRLREREFDLTGDYIDLLFDVLDQLNGWLDHLDQHGELPDDAEVAASALIERLGSEVPRSGATAPPESPAEPPAQAPQWVAALPPGWLHEAREQARQAPDASVLALTWRPDESAIYDGRDPLADIAELTGLVGFRVEPREPWPDMELLDPYRCMLVFRALLVTTIEAMTQHFGDALAQCQWQEVSAALQAEDTDAAAPQLAAGTDAESAASGDAANATPDGDSPELEALFESQSEAAQEGDPATASPDGDSPELEALFEAYADDEDDAEAGQADDAMARDIFDEQRRVLRTPIEEAQRSGRLDAVVRVIGDVLAQQRREQSLEAWQAAGRLAQSENSEAPLLSWLDEQLPAEPEDSGAEVPADGAPAPSQPERAQDAGRESRAAPAERDTAEPAAESRRPSSGRGGAGESSGGQPDSRPLRVEQHRIDELMNLAGELIVAKNALPFLARRIENGDDRDELVRELKVSQANIDRISNRIQDAVMSARMVPMSTVFQRFPRLVRDIARKLDKQVELVTEGEETEADKNIIGGLGDPLTHLIRNSLDHGMEMPDERVAAGKSATGRVVLRAATMEDHVMIELSDDGRGIDPEAVMRRAYQKGLVEEHELDAMSDEEALNLILLPGFSTADQVSDLSGRGVGMDAVRNAIQEVGGRLAIESEQGAGSTMRIMLPMSMAVTRVLVVDIDDQYYGVPMPIIRETVRLPRSAFNRVKQTEVMALRDELIPVHRSRQLLGLAAPQEPPEEQAVLILEVNNHKVGLVVDEFRQSMDIVQKPMEGIMAQFDIFAGSALTGDGRVLLVLNAPALLKKATTAGAATLAEAERMRQEEEV